MMAEKGSIVLEVPMDKNVGYIRVWPGKYSAAGKSAEEMMCSAHAGHYVGNFPPDWTYRSLSLLPAVFEPM